jgi:hypothetical protein
VNAPIGAWERGVNRFVGLYLHHPTAAEMSVDATHLNPDAEMSIQSEPYPSQQHPVNAEMPSNSIGEPHVEFLPDELSSASGEEVNKKPVNESRKRRKRGARMRYTDEEIKQMRQHLQEQMELSPRPSLLEVWTAYAAKVFA